MTGTEPGTRSTSEAPWKDPDDAPEWSDAIFDQADLMQGEKLVRRGRPRSENPKVPINIRLSPDVVERFRATGPGWQSRIDAALKQWLAEHPEQV